MKRFNVPTAPRIDGNSYDFTEFYIIRLPTVYNNIVKHIFIKRKYSRYLRCLRHLVWDTSTFDPKVI